MSLETVLMEIRAERARQDLKWGAHRQHPDEVWLAILMEEVGEAAAAALEQRHGSGTDADLARELLQVAAVAVCWLEAIQERNAR